MRRTSSSDLPDRLAYSATFVAALSKARLCWVRATAGISPNFALTFSRWARTESASERVDAAVPEVLAAGPAAAPRARASLSRLANARSASVPRPSCRPAC